MRQLVTVFVLTFLGVSVYAQSKGKGGGLKASIENGKVVYEQHCALCHQADGTGVQDINPPLIKTKWVLGDKKQLINIILKGMDTEIEVNGVKYNTPMPPLDYISDKEIADVLTYLRNSFSNKAGAVTEAEVKVQRSTKR
jgi:mono/diheme cytochrome c family protein